MEGFASPDVFAQLHDKYAQIVSLYQQAKCSRKQAAVLIGQLHTLSGSYANQGALTLAEHAELQDLNLPPGPEGSDGACTATVDNPAALPSTNSPGVLQTAVAYWFPSLGSALQKLENVSGLPTGTAALILAAVAALIAILIAIFVLRFVLGGGR